MSLHWCAFAVERPDAQKPALVTDGKRVSAAVLTGKIGNTDMWHGCGLGGYEWEWDLGFQPEDWTHWLYVEDFLKALPVPISIILPP